MLHAALGALHLGELDGIQQAGEGGRQIIRGAGGAVYHGSEAVESVHANGCIDRAFVAFENTPAIVYQYLQRLGIMDGYRTAYNYCQGGLGFAKTVQPFAGVLHNNFSGCYVRHQ